MSIGTGSGTSSGFVFGPVDKPTATITVWLAKVAKGKLMDDPTLSLTTATIEGVVYSNLLFDLNDRLISANVELPKNSEGETVNVGQNTTGLGGVNHFWMRITAPGGVSESIHFTPELVIKERWVTIPKQHHYREIYENGSLRRRDHYKERQVEGGTQSYVEKQEKFP